MPIVRLTTEPLDLAPEGARRVWVRNVGPGRVTARNGENQIQLRTGRDHLFTVAGPVVAFVTAPDGGVGDLQVEVDA